MKFNMLLLTLAMFTLMQQSTSFYVDLCLYYENKDCLWGTYTNQCGRTACVKSPGDLCSKTDSDEACVIGTHCIDSKCEGCSILQPNYCYP